MFLWYSVTNKHHVVVANLLSHNDDENYTYELLLHCATLATLSGLQLCGKQEINPRCPWSTELTAVNNALCLPVEIRGVSILGVEY